MNNSTYLNEDVDLTNCDREPIHLLGNIQSFGCFIAMRADWLVAFCSENVEAYLGKSVDEVIGEPLKTWFDCTTVHHIRSALQSAMITGRNERLFDEKVISTGMPVDISVHHNGQYIIVEFEEIKAERAKDEQFVRSLLTQFYRAKDSNDLIEQVTQQLQLITGYDRVMMYRFLSDGSGEVVAESKNFQLEPFVGLRYPASDIPKQARALYVKNLLRVIADVDDEVVPILPKVPSLDRQIDLSFSTLRAVSPIHIEYLKNMGVQASMSVSIIVKGKLWGLFACHHYKPKVPSYFQRTELELFAEVFALELSSKLMAENELERDRVRHVHNRIMSTMSTSESLVDSVAAQFRVIRDLVSCHGIAVIVDGEVRSEGLCLNSDMLKKLSRCLNALAPSEVAAIDTLADFLPGYVTEDHNVAGVLAVPVSKSPRDYLLFFREPQTRTVNWAGNPEKPVSLGPNGSRLLPRTSFEIWQQTHTDSCAQWQEQVITDAESLRVTLLEVMIRHVQEREAIRQQASRKHEILISELNHRVRNILNLVNAIVVQTEQSGRSLGDFVEVLTGRLVALASAHDQLTASEWSEVSFRKLLETEIQAYINLDNNIELDGEDVLISPYAATPLVLVIHEMFTNAAKYGALSASGEKGCVRISWSLNRGSDLVITWCESGGPPVSPPAHESFGMTMIRSVIPHELEGDVDINFHPAGVSATLMIPNRYLVVNTQSVDEQLNNQPSEDNQTLSSLPESALVVEDSLVIALDMQKKLKSIGIPNVCVSGSTDAARRIVAGRQIGLAVMDIHLGKETSFELIRELLQQHVPLMIVSGYGEDIVIPDDLVSVPVLTKPIADQDLKFTLAQLLNDQIDN